VKVGEFEYNAELASRIAYGFIPLYAEQR
jgi:hypothetical protein